MDDCAAVTAVALPASEVRASVTLVARADALVLFTDEIVRLATDVTTDAVDPVGAGGGVTGPVTGCTVRATPAMATPAAPLLTMLVFSADTKFVAPLPEVMFVSALLMLVARDVDAVATANATFIPL
jgi:hypothetical protein